MKNTFLILMILLVAITANSQEFDTIDVKTIGPGVKYTHLLTDDPVHIYITEIDLTNEFIKMETVCSNDVMPDPVRETTSSMSKRNDTEGHRVVGAVNADFFSYTPGLSIGLQARNGEVIKSYGGSHAMMFDKDNKPHVGKPYYEGYLFANDKIGYIDGVNMYREDIYKWFGHLQKNRTVMYNQYFGTHTKTKDGETEMLLLPLDGWELNSGAKTRCVVKAISDEQNMKIEEGHVVTASLGDDANFVKANIAVGDTIEIQNEIKDYYFYYMPINNVMEVIGGYPRFILDGKDYVDTGCAELNASIDKAARQPRTAIGFDKDSTKLFMVACDGRQNDFSIGLTMYQLADFMINKLGVYTGLNFDSGGSTTMVVRNDIMNSPSDDTGERPVINALMVVSSAPQGALNRIEVQPSEIKILKGQGAEFNIRAWNEFDELNTVDKSQITYSLSADFGTIDNNGVFSAGNTGAEGYVIAEYQGKTDSAKVVVKTIESIEISPNEIMTDNNNPVQFSANVIDSEGVSHNYNVDKFEWSVVDVSIGNIDALGLFTAQSSGETQVTAKVDGVEASATVKVQIGTEFIQLDPMDETTGWEFESDKIDSLSVTINNQDQFEGDGCFEVYYRFTFDNKTPSVYLHKDFEIYGIPDSVWMNIKLNGKSHRLVYHFINQDNKNVICPTLFKEHYGFIMPGAEIKFSKVEDHPYKLETIRLEIRKGINTYEKGKSYQAKILLDNLQVSYPGHTVIMDINSKLISPLRFINVFPNPATEKTNLKFGLKTKGHVNLRIYNINGQLVETLINNEFLPAGNHDKIWNVNAQTPGTYIYQLEVDGKLQSGKIVIE